MSPLAPTEPIIEPEIPIVDAHHHLWFQPETALAAIEEQDNVVAQRIAPIYRRQPRYLFGEYLADATAGHDVRASVFVEGHAMRRADGPEAMRSVGEVEFANGVAAMAASGIFEAVEVCAGIIGGVDLRLGDAVEEVLHAHLQAGGGRYRGVRNNPAAGYDEDAKICGRGIPHLLQDASFRAGFKRLRALGLSFDVWLLEPQLPELIALARDFPDTQIILDHIGTPVGVSRYAGRLAERFPVWRDNIRRLSRHANVAVKLGGLGMPYAGFTHDAGAYLTSSHLAAEWGPYIETCIESFGVDRCMFESNFPMDAATCGYAVLWNTFKRLAAGASETEKAALFSDTATRIYKLDG
jgi:predicted TIM-barrel fold metal-dependent hydrolase